MTPGLTRYDFLTSTPLAAAIGALRMDDVKPFRIAARNEMLADLRGRLSHTRFPDEAAGAGWAYGTNLEYMRDLIDYWLHRYDWRAQEDHLNSFPQFITKIDGFDVHFIHVRSKSPAPIPLILTHGWPSSFTEMLRIIPLLTDTFDVVVPSVPGFGFSSRPPRPGFVATHDLWARLMTERLGYKRFAAEGGDIGAGITTRLGRFHADKLLGICVLAATTPYIDADSPALSPAERKYVADGELWDSTEGAYSALQSTKPQTLSYGLNDSPAGLAGWIVEKFRSWSDCGGNVESRFTKDELLNNIMIYWLTQSIGSSVRYYFESARHAPPMRKGERVDPPTAAVIFPKDLGLPPREWIERSYNLQRYTLMPRGGHFAAHEEPALLANELRAFFRTTFAETSRRFPGIRPDPDTTSDVRPAAR